MRIRALAGILFALAAGPFLWGESPERAVVVGTAGFDFPPTLVACDILAEAYERIGCRADFVEFPPNRMIALLKKGEIDALILAEPSFKDLYPGTIMVPTEIWTDELVVYSKRTLDVTGWESLKPLTVGYIAGMLIIEKSLSNGYDAVPVQTPTQLFEMLNAGRTDAVVTSRSIGQYMLPKLAMEGISPAAKTLARVPNYHFLAGKNAELAARLSVALADMEKSGRIAAITKATLARLLPNGER